MHRYVALLRRNSFHMTQIKARAASKFSSLVCAGLRHTLSLGLLVISIRGKSSDIVSWPDEQGCPFITADPKWAPSVSGIVRKHQTPLITVKQSGVDQKVEVHVTTAEKLYQSGNGFCSRLLNNGATILGLRSGSRYLLNLTVPYVCISHVWAESVSLRWCF
jgi:hypothetical protein